MVRHILRQDLRFICAMLCCCAGLLSGPAASQGNYPSKPMRMIVSSAAGGGADILARLFGEKLSERFGRPVIVENIAGASGLLGYQTVQKAPADAHTMVMTTNSAYNATMYTSKIGDPRKALAPVAQLTAQPIVMLVSNSLPIRNMQDLIAYGKKNPDGLAYASPGIATSSHLVGEIINHKTGLKLVHVPYKGIGPGIVDAIGGRIQLVFTSPTSAGPHVRAGKLRMVVSSAGKRSAGLPDLPVMAEQGVDVDWMSWFGVFTTFGSPRQNINALNAAINQIASTPEVLKLYASDGSDPAPGTPEQFGKAVFHVLDTGARLIKEMGIKLEE